MSTINNQYIAPAASATGLSVASDVSPIVEALLNDVEVSAINAAEVTDKGKCIVFVTTKDENDDAEIRPVADSSGNTKLFANSGAVMTMTKRTNLPGGSAVRIVKKTVAQKVGDPIATLKSKHRQAVRESEQITKPLGDLANKISGAESLGWDTDPTGSATREEYDDLKARQTSVTEWKTVTDGRVTFLATALTNAGISPVTYLPLPPETP